MEQSQPQALPQLVLHAVKERGRESLEDSITCPVTQCACLYKVISDVPCAVGDFAKQLDFFAGSYVVH